MGIELIKEEDVCTSEAEIVETIRKKEISSLQKLVKYWKIIIFADILLIMLNIVIIYYKMVVNRYVISIILIIQFLIVLIGIIFVILLKREIRRHIMIIEMGKEL
jgi:uncharacterized membrane protein YcjF (UPF0283 family)